MQDRSVSTVSLLIPFWFTEWKLLFPSGISLSLSWECRRTLASASGQHPSRSLLHPTQGSALALQHLGDSSAYLTCKVYSVIFQLSGCSQVILEEKTVQEKNPTSLFIFSTATCLTWYFIQYWVKWACTNGMGAKISITQSINHARNLVSVYLI